MILICLKLHFLFKQTTDQKKHSLKHHNGCETGRKANENLEFGMCDMLAWAGVEACLIMTPLKLM